MCDTNQIKMTTQMFLRKDKKFSALFVLFSDWKFICNLIDLEFDSGVIQN